MIIFAENEARHFCQNFNASNGNVSESFLPYCKRVLSNSRNLREGTSDFDDFRSNLLRNSERNLFLSTSNYYSTHRLLVAGFASWAHVTSYYGAFYSAKAILGMFGVCVEHDILVDVSSGGIGSQELRVKKDKIAKAHLSTIAGGKNGSHQIFWSAFYKAGASLHAYVTDPVLRLALTPVGSSTTWQIESRNDINYDTLTAIGLINDFDRNFIASKFPAGLPGALNTQYKISEALIMLAFKYAKEFGLSTDTLHALSGNRTLSRKLNRFIVKAGRGITVANNTRKLFV